MRYPHQYGVPMKVFLLPIVRSNWADTPKSTEKQWEKEKNEKEEEGRKGEIKNKKKLLLV